ncbi:Dihydroprymidine dehydrogenase domain II protein [Dehalogenimonas alkenigignens]|uniref:Dihydroprymidine dehydrogenase domain II protein n=1 Tax=Dehalogenimonas alkenigignens TaxID=1217799 RepID=A0A0W0GJ61_9CHLR|nr:FAD-dependent oxidoreductase [Dehalogenimonas alkenigignens]KTB48603.1 Dihydroprymidine dehydrogenase domain II protein [Dehalogenimonas alkenigignens]
MAEEIRTGVYVCHCGINIASVVDVAAVAEYAGTLPAVVIARANKYTCSDPGQDIIKKDIAEFGLNRIVVAACSPTMHEKTYRRVLQNAGLNPYLLEIANIREHCAWVNRENPAAATQKAKDAVRAALRRVGLQEPIEPRSIEVNPSTLVVGGGIAGITAALEIAESGRKVYLVEKSPTIGGHMAQLDKTFPTLDCAACISTPRMSQAGQHPNIELLSYSEVSTVSGHAGNFKVTVNCKARYIREKDCKGCGDCAAVCPVSISSEFDLGLVDRKAAYRPFPQSVPNTYTIDRRGTPPCRAACPAGVNAQGYIALIAQGKFTEALEVVRRTMPFAAVCGRVCTHPCEAECGRSDVDEAVSIRALKRFIAEYEIENGRTPGTPSISRAEKVAVVGSGPSGLACAYDLLKLGYPVTVFEADEKAGGMLRYGIPVYRLPEAALDNDIAYLEELGADIKTGIRADSIEQLKDAGYRSVFVACGAWQSLKLGITGETAEGVYDALGFLKQVRQGDSPPVGEKVAVIGGGNAAIDAARTAVRLGAQDVTIVYRRSRAEMPAIAEEVAAAESEGVRLTLLAAPVAVIEKNGKSAGLRCIRMELGEPDASGRRRPVPIAGSEFDIQTDNVIVAVGQSVAASSFTELPRRTNSTITADPVTLATGIEGVFSGGDAITGPATVIEAIAAGKEAAVSIDRYLNGKDLAIDRKPRLNVVQPSLKGVARAQRVEPPHAAIDTGSFSETELTFSQAQAMAEAARCLNCAGCSDCRQCVEACDAKCIDFNQKAESVEIEVGNIIVATGYDTFDPSTISHYGYGRFENVITSLELERLASASGPTSGEIRLTDGRKPESVAIVHCVGSRDKNYHEYCSQICCMYSLKQAHLIQERTGASVYQMYIDLRCAGKGYEEFYKRVGDEGVNFVRGKVAEITDKTTGEETPGKLIVIVEDTLQGAVLRVPVDMVVLAVAAEPQKDTEAVGRLFGLSRSADGFFLERHPKLDPVATMNDGVFIAGCAQGPKDIPQTVAQAQAAAARVLATIAKGRIDLEPRVSEVIETNCDGCAYCVEPCPFSALTLVEFMKDGELKKLVESNPVKCRGCGVCMATCPKAGIVVKGFTPDQLRAMVDALIGCV